MGTPEATPSLILASASPRRVALLTTLGLQFEVRPSSVDETIHTPMSPEEAVIELAGLKARAVAAETGGEAHTLVLGADTIVAYAGELLGKPGNPEEARRMLRLLSGTSHQVFTGVCLVLPSGGEVSACQETIIHFRELCEEEIDAYIATGEPLDKAGAYALQGAAAAFVSKLEGCYTNVIGLPVPLTVSILRQAGLPVLGTPKTNDR
ncbi:MAG: septum formation inhibitor Maf [Candidatus Melainabacteria bacterium]|nr:septum formation inhibitor Maf [Candidatus Melainabacteria bacterium]